MSEMEAPAGDDEQRNEGRGETSEAITHRSVGVPNCARDTSAAASKRLRRLHRLQWFAGFIQAPRRSHNYACE